MDCQHFYILGKAHNGVTKGICQKCGHEEIFRNPWKKGRQPILVPKREMDYMKNCMKEALTMIHGG